MAKKSAKTECCLIELPTDPNPAVDVVLRKLNGEDVSLGELAHASVHLQAWGVGRMHDCPEPEPVPVVGASREELKKCCEQVKEFCAAGEPGTVKGPFPVPIKPFVMLILQALEQWLAGQDF